VLFKTNEAILSALSYSELDKVVGYLKNNEQISIEIIGHTDSLGNENKNKILSTNRAIAVKDYLISKNIDNKRITYLGCGGTRPIATNKTEDGRRRNRRVEFVLKD
jgi:outer membrane protein OmpA-like peptidoglycan-associated protein